MKCSLVLVFALIFSSFSFADGQSEGRNRTSRAVRKVVKSARQLDQVIDQQNDLDLRTLKREINELRAAAESYAQSLDDVNSRWEYENARSEFVNLYRQYRDIKRTLHSDLGRNEDHRRPGHGRWNNDDDEAFQDDAWYAQLITAWADFVNSFKELKDGLRTRPERPGHNGPGHDGPGHGGHHGPVITPVAVTVVGTMLFQDDSGSSTKRAEQGALNKCQQYTAVTLSCNVTRSWFEVTAWRYKAEVTGSASFTASGPNFEIARNNALATCRGKGLNCQ